MLPASPGRADVGRYGGAGEQIAARYDLADEAAGTRAPPHGDAARNSVTASAV